MSNVLYTYRYMYVHIYAKTHIQMILTIHINVIDFTRTGKNRIIRVYYTLQQCCQMVTYFESRDTYKLVISHT